MTLTLRTWLLITAVISPTFALSQSDGASSILILEHLYKTGTAQWQLPSQASLQDSPPLSQQAAAVLASDILQRLSIETKTSTTVQGQLLSNSGVFQTYSGDLIGGRKTLDQALDTLMKDRHQFDPDLATVVTAIGINAFLQEDFKTAENHFRWSQHIQHREDGLYAANQAKNLNWLTRVYLAEADFDSADIAQRYILRIARKTYPEGSPELTKVKDGIAKYLAQRGKMISPLSDELQRALRQSLFSDALDLLNENLSSTEALSGPADLALVSTLETKAEIYYWRGNHNRQQERALERALSILQLQPVQSFTRVAAAWFNLADGYILTGNRKAIEAYYSGWVLSVQPQHTATDLRTTAPTSSVPGSTLSVPKASDPTVTSAFQSPTPNAHSADEPAVLPTGPVLLWPEAFSALYFDPVNKEKYPSKDGYFVDFSFTISEMGKPKRIRITDRNVPSEEARWARASLHNSRFRPALLDGVPVPFEATFRQTFERVSDPEDQPAFETNAAPLPPDSSSEPTPTTAP